MRQILLGVVLTLVPVTPQSSVEPIVRIGLTQNAATVTVRSAETFMVEGARRGPRRSLRSSLSILLRTDPLPRRICSTASP